MDHLPEHIREQLEAQKEQCIMCRILKGEVPSKRIFEDGVLTGLLDINPATKGHSIIMPNEHYPILPLLSPQEFDRLFGLMPQFARAVADAVLADGVTVFIANGGVAGQTSPHFIVHLIPRERNDRLGFDFTPKAIDKSALESVTGQARQVLSLMLAKHIGFQSIESDALLASEEITISRSVGEQVAGHLELRFSDNRSIKQVSAEQSARLFRAASLASTALFENLGAQGTNIIADTREAFVIHVIPRTESDGLALSWTPMQDPPDPDAIAGQLAKRFFEVQVRVEKGEFDQPGLTAPSEQPASVDQDRERIDAAWARLRE